MPAGTIDIGGQKVSRNVVYGAGAVALGIVGYAWWTKGSAATAEAPAPSLPLPVEEPTDFPGFSVSGGGPAPVTNAEWSELAVSRLRDIGIDAPMVSSALGKYLARRPLNPVERDLVEQAIRAAGPPPQGIYTVIEEVPGAATPGMTAPKNVTAQHTGGGVVYISWEPVVGAAKYALRATIDGLGGGSYSYENGPSHTSGPWYEAAGKSVKFYIAAVDASGQVGPESTISYTGPVIPGAAPAPAPPPAPAPTPAPAPAPSGGPPAPIGSLAVIAVAPNRVRLEFEGTPGSTYYLYRWETASEVSGWAQADPSGVFEVTWMFPRGTQFSANVVACNQFGCSGGVGNSNVAVAK